MGTLSELIHLSGKILFPSIIFMSVFTGQNTVAQNTVTPTIRMVFATPTPTPTITPTPTPTPLPTPIHTPRPTQTPTPTQAPISGQQLDTWFTSYSSVYSIDRSLLHKIAVCESNLRTNAVNGPYAGMYQFSEGTWRSTRTRMNLDSNPELRFNPEEAIKTAAFRISIVGAAAWPNCSK